MSEQSLRFPEGFAWGVSTASYQIEGAVDEDGRGTSIWDTFSHTPGNVVCGDTGDVACDHYHRYREDVALMRDLGVDTYRFSVAWPRIQPTGKGPVEQAGLDFYRRLVDELAGAGIRSCATLYHWDLPQPLEDAGGWTERDTAERFAEYAAVVHDALGDRVAQWITVNEPLCSAFHGYSDAQHAPGRREGHGALAAAHHLLVGHGLAMRALRANRRGDETFGITLNMNHFSPATAAAEDVAAARRAELLGNRVFSDPVLAGRYPDDATEVWDGVSDFSFRRDGDLDVIATPLDFLGVNNYMPSYTKDAPTVDPDPRRRVATDIGVVDDPPAELPRTAMGWPVEADGIRRLLNWVRATYPDVPPIYITENGAAFPDVVVDGRVDDPRRIAYLDAYTGAVRAAIDDGVDVRGYYCWSLMDNFEWAVGYSKRFGLVYVDYETQQRIPKTSYQWYRDRIAAARG